MLKGVVQGYKPQVDWGGESGSATIMLGHHNVRLATSGWRRRCLFTLLVTLLLISFLNFLLTLWILRSIKFNAEGAGLFHIVAGGVTLEGEAVLGGKISASKIQGRHQQDLQLKGYHNISILNLESDGNVTSALLLHDRGVRVDTQQLRVLDSSGNALFTAGPEGTSVGAKALKVDGPGIAKLEGSMMTPKVYSEDVYEFRLESSTRDIRGTAAEELVIEARDGDISMVALAGADLHAGGKIKLETPNVFFPNVEIHGNREVFQPTTPPPTESNRKSKTRLKTRSRATARYVPTLSPIENQVQEPETTHLPTTPITHIPGPGVQVFQLCVCPNGKLFLHAADSPCKPNESTCR